MSDVHSTQGAFSWNELMTTDVEGAKKFYRELLGWEMRDMPMENMTYTLVKAGDKDVGGIMPIPPQVEGAPAHWGCYITVDDVDAIAKKAAQLGAHTLVPPTDIPDVGRFYSFRDPQGAAISVMTYTKK